MFTQGLASADVEGILVPQRGLQNRTTVCLLHCLMMLRSGSGPRSARHLQAASRQPGLGSPQGPQTVTKLAAAAGRVHEGTLHEGQQPPVSAAAKTRRPAGTASAYIDKPGQRLPVQVVRVLARRQLP